MAGQVSRSDVIAAYRHLYRALLHAVQFAKPARYTARDQLREGFRRGDVATFDPQKIARTVEFLHGAARERGLEHRILKNLLLVRYWRDDMAQRSGHGRARGDRQQQIHASAYEHYDMTLAMLNNTMGLCLR